MTRRKNSEFLKILGITALCIGLFSAVFLGLNSRALAAVTSQTENIPIAAAAMNLPATPADGPAADIPAADVQQDSSPEAYEAPEVYSSSFHNPVFIVLVHPYTQENPPSAASMSPEEAAQTGVQYLYDMFGQNLDGMVVMMQYSTHPSITRSLWFGMVAETAEDAEKAPLLGFTICAASGERIGVRSRALFDFLRPDVDYITSLHLVNLIHPPVHPDDYSGEIPYSIAAVIEGRCIETLWNELMDGIVPPAGQIEGYLQMAKAYAAKHFANTYIANAEFRMARHSGYFILDGDGDLTAILAQLIFSVTDSTGRDAMVVLVPGGETLLQILCTQHNDIIPGHGDAW